jgi:hypothetical protein
VSPFEVTRPSLQRLRRARQARETAFRAVQPYRAHCMSMTLAGARLEPAPVLAGAGCEAPATGSPRGERLMTLLSEDDLNLAGMTPQELAATWDCWFDLAQGTNSNDPPYEHGVFTGATLSEILGTPESPPPAAADPGKRHVHAGIRSRR